MAKKKYYAVAKGRATGIFETWNDCEAQTRGFSGSKFKSFKTREQAEAYLTKEGVDFRNVKRTKCNDEKRDSANEPVAKRRRSTYDAEEDTLPVRASASAPSNSKIVIVIFFDGGARGNPGVAGAGAVLEVIKVSATGDRFEHRCFIRHFVGRNATNNVAEYEGFLQGLSEAKREISSFVSDTTSGSQATAEIKVYGDSKLVIQQLEGKYKCKSPNLKKLYEKALSLIKEIKAMKAIQVEIKLNHVERESNSMADGLANEAMNERRSWKTVKHTTEIRGYHTSRESAFV